MSIGGVLGGALDGQLAGLFAFQDAAGIDTALAMSLQKARQPSGLWKFASRIERR